jgi:putative phosphoesterase
LRYARETVRIALISDLHGNEHALNAVLDDARRQGTDRVICLGDVATLGTHPREVIGRLKELGCLCIMGNHDEFLLEPELIRKYTEVPIISAAVDWCRDRLSADELAFLGTFARSQAVPLEGGATLFVYHGSPRSHMEDILATTPAHEVDVMLDGHAATVLAGGHTHIQMVRQHRGSLIVNPGSVGMPFREYVSGREPKVLIHAEYATIDCRDGAVSVTAHRVPVDRDRLRALAAASDNPLAPTLVKHYS